MRNSFWLIAALFALMGTEFEATAMDYEEVKMFVFKRGETIFGEEFIAANEGVVDYIATLNRPTGTFQAIKYLCKAKVRYIRPDVNSTGSNPQPIQYVDITTVYDLKDCAPAE